jgi:hypothetical protein
MILSLIGWRYPSVTRKYRHLAATHTESHARSGEKFEHEGQRSDLAIQFCKDVQHISDSGYVEFGQLYLYYFSPVTGDTDFVQEYYFGDLQHCEQYGFDKMGHSA